MTRTERNFLLQARGRHGRRKHGIFIAEGVRCCREGLLRLPRLLLRMFCSDTFAGTADFASFSRALPEGAACETLPDAEFAKVTATENPQGVLCLFRAVPEAPPATRLPEPYVLVLDRIQEPGNLGAILRTAWAAGLGEAWVTEGATDPFSPKAIRAGMGAQFAMTLRQFADLRAVDAERRRLGGGGGRVWAAVPAGGAGCFSLEYDPAGGALVIGNEANGIHAADLAWMDKVTIPMPGNAESLNAAQAATILLFEGVRRGLEGKDRS